MNQPQLHNINGINFNLDMQGEGEPLLLLHGGYSNLEVWNRHAAPLAEDFRMIRYDQRGYGRTEPPAAPFSYYEDIRAVLDHLGIARTHIAASSFGGSAAIDFALAYPERVNKLILVAPSLNGRKYPLRLSWEGVKDFLRVQRSGIEKAADHFMNNRFWRYLVPQEAQTRAEFKQLYLGNPGFYQSKPSLQRPLMPLASGRLGELRMPVLILEAGRDLPFNRQTCRLLEQQLPAARLITLEDCGHYPHLEQPQQFIAEVKRFLQVK
ncbi:alpha/beta fold hydrolase [Paenibacillus donghaensis]|uniref:AB hydrolase-1 domain-containing protein n=1 Tax=Paenibacillus donghaensis TaxID=414771 RepID=A0A2Z2K555_9BACL|nr:alpha/beta hydrolase [Paenibacillus donghaensis]ASA21166.1 hypothetical protein B9T62_10430 [Paenibacillus donghaensis]